MFWRRKRQSLRSHWESFYSENLVDLEKGLAHEKAWFLWEQSRSPESAAESKFQSAVRILLGSSNRALAERYLQLSLEMIERITRDDRLAGSVDFPRNRGQMVRTKVFAESLLGRPWDDALLLAASNDYETDCRDHCPTPSDWHSQMQYYYLVAVHLALLATDVERAHTLLQTPPRPLKYQEEHAELLKGLVRFAQKDLSDQEAQSFVTSFEKYYDDFRDPRVPRPEAFRENIGALELGLLRERYIRNPTTPVSWSNVLEDHRR
jgi:hypothetical protein